jgi:hypothetical protein
MTYISEDPTYLAGAILLVGAAFLVALRVTQQGKYLIRAGVAAGLALTVVAVAWLWVTDNERIQHVVYDLRQGVLNSDAESVLGHMTPSVQYSHGNKALSADATRALVRASLSRTRFDFVRISGLRTSVAPQSRRGTAEFRVFTRGAISYAPGTSDAGTAVTVWSLGFEETEPGVWKVNRITLLESPQGTPPVALSQSGF